MVIKMKYTFGYEISSIKDAKDKVIYHFDSPKYVIFDKNYTHVFESLDSYLEYINKKRDYA